MKYSLQLLALASSTLCGLFFLGKIFKLLLAYNFAYHRFAPALVNPNDFTVTLLLSIGFLCSAILYRIVARSNNRNSTLMDPHRLTAFSSKLRWSVVILGTVVFLLAHLVLDRGAMDLYVAYFGGIAASVFLVFPDASYFLGNWISSFKADSLSHSDSPSNPTTPA
jgi:hypothetical protein